MASLIGRGASADVFDLGDNTVVKAYRRIRQTQGPVRNWDDHEFMSRQFFATEVRAYERLQARPDLAEYTPRFFGPIELSEYDLHSSSPDEPLIPGCAFRLERIDGRDTKISQVPSPLQQRIEAILEDIRDTVERIHVWDCSCFVPGPRTDFVVIDFGVWEDWADPQIYLDKHGVLPHDIRERFRVP